VIEVVNKCLRYFRRIILSIPSTHVGTNVISLGSEYGNKSISNAFEGKLLKMVSAGIGTDMSFEIELFLNRDHCCNIVLLDPTPKAAFFFQ
jgi:hypothetical protein